MSYQPKVYTLVSGRKNFKPIAGSFIRTKRRYAILEGVGISFMALRGRDDGRVLFFDNLFFGFQRFEFFRGEACDAGSAHAGGMGLQGGYLVLA